MACLILTSKQNNHTMCAENSLCLDTHLALNAQYVWYIISLRYYLGSYEKSEKLKLHLVSKCQNKTTKIQASK